MYNFSVIMCDIYAKMCIITSMIWTQMRVRCQGCDITFLYFTGLLAISHIPYFRGIYIKKGFFFFILFIKGDRYRVKKRCAISRCVGVLSFWCFDRYRFMVLWCYGHNSYKSLIIMGGVTSQGVLGGVKVTVKAMRSGERVANMLELCGYFVKFGIATRSL